MSDVSLEAKQLRQAIDLGDIASSAESARELVLQVLIDDQELSAIARALIELEAIAFAIDDFIIPQVNTMH
jgi:hypothetical protein